MANSDLSRPVSEDAAPLSLLAVEPGSMPHAAASIMNVEENSWALRKAREALTRAESALALHQAAGVSDQYRLTDLLTARDLAKAVCVLIEEDERVGRHSREPALEPGHRGGATGGGAT